MPIFEISVKTVIEAKDENFAILKAKGILQAKIYNDDIEWQVVDISPGEDYQKVADKYF